MDHAQAVGHLQHLTHLRNTSPVLQTGQQREMWQDDDVYAFSRANDTDEAIAIFHNGTGQSHRTIPLLKESQLQSGQVLVDTLSGREFAIKDGKIEVDLQPLTPLILFPKP